MVTFIDGHALYQENSCLKKWSVRPRTRKVKSKLPAVFAKKLVVYLQSAPCMKNHSGFLYYWILLILIHRRKKNSSSLTSPFLFKSTPISILFSIPDGVYTINSQSDPTPNIWKSNHYPKHWWRRDQRNHPCCHSKLSWVRTSGKLCSWENLNPHV